MAVFCENQGFLKGEVIVQLPCLSIVFGRFLANYLWCEFSPSGFVGAHPVGRSLLISASAKCLAQNLGGSKNAGRRCFRTDLPDCFPCTGKGWPSFLDDAWKPRMKDLWVTTPKFNSEFTPEKQWLEDYTFLFGKVKKFRGELLNFGRVYHRFRLRWTKGSLDGVRNFSCSRVAKVVRGVPIYKCWQLETLNFGRRFGFQFFFSNEFGLQIVFGHDVFCVDILKSCCNTWTSSDNMLRSANLRQQSRLPLSNKKYIYMY